MESPVIEPVQGALAERIVSAPCLSAAEAAHARVEAWLAELSGPAAGLTLRRLLASHPQTLSLITGLTEGSPYLWELVRAEPERLATLLESDPDRRLEALIGEATRGVAEATAEADVMRLLRRMRAEGALLV